MMLAAVPITHLPSFHRKPSWVNKAGRVDRSACMEIRASELWRSIDSIHWRKIRTSIGRQAHTHITINSRLMLGLHNSRSPRKLRGDLRTPKSNAMKHVADPSAGHRRRTLKPHEQRWIALPDLNDCHYSNPNKGATRTKKLGLWDEDPPIYNAPWQQHIRIERWKRGKSKVQSSKSKRSTHHCDRRQCNQTFSSTPGSQSSIVDRQSSIPSPPNHWHYLICPACDRRVFKLFMVLATEQELIDAEIAEGWIKRINAHPQRRRQRMRDSELRTLHSELIARYGPLFRDRRLICKKCLKLRYGEVKKSRLKVDSVQGARRRADRRMQDEIEDQRRREDDMAAIWAQATPHTP